MLIKDELNISKGIDDFWFVSSEGNGLSVDDDDDWDDWDDDDDGENRGQNNEKKNKLQPGERLTQADRNKKRRLAEEAKVHKLIFTFLKICKWSFICIHF